MLCYEVQKCMKSAQYRNLKMTHITKLCLAHVPRQQYSFHKLGASSVRVDKSWERMKGCGGQQHGLFTSRLSCVWFTWFAAAQWSNFNKKISFYLLVLLEFSSDSLGSLMISLWIIPRSSWKHLMSSSFWLRRAFSVGWRKLADTLQVTTEP